MAELRSTLVGVQEGVVARFRSGVKGCIYN